MQLAQLLQDFQTAVISTEATAFDEGQHAHVDGHFSVYRNAYRIRLRSALQDNFPVLYRMLGDETFSALADAYIDAHPSQFRNIRWFGHKLCEFMLEHSPLLSHPSLLDIARLDWALRGAFDAKNAALLRPSDLAKLSPEDWPNQRFQFIPSFTWLHLNWQIEPIWHALSQDENAHTHEPQRLAHDVVVWRPALECLWRSLESLELTGLQALQAGLSFGQYCEQIQACLPTDAPHDAATTAALLLRRWVDEGLLASATTQEP